jgi:hypothetical protein
MFELMIEKSRYLKLAIFIDGIDEFEGDHRDISIFLRSIVSPRVKLVVSSRPLNACLEALADCPKLRLQDLTKRDMEAYVHGELTSHRLMVGLAQRFPTSDSDSDLSVQITEKAEGVFLWVKLVVCLLIEGLENGDDLTELQARLKALPSDLRDLYKRMFGKMQATYRKQAAVIFQLLRRWDEAVHDQLLPGLVLSYATGSPLNVFNLSNTPITNDVYDWTMKALEKRITSRCCGLHEIRYTRGKDRPSGASLTDTLFINEVHWTSVTYLHRTVAEFMKVDEVWEEICALTQDTSMAFDASTNLASACIFLMGLGRNYKDNTVEWYLACIARFIRTAARMPPEIINKYLTKIDTTMSQLPEGSHRHPLSEATRLRWHWSAKAHEAAMLPIPETSTRIENYASIYTLAAEESLFIHPIAIPDDLGGEARYIIVLHALKSWHRKPQNAKIDLASLHERSSTLSYLYQHISPPESVAFGYSLWTRVVVVCSRLVDDERNLEAAVLLKVSLAASGCPKFMWQQDACVTASKSAASLLASLQSGLRLMPSQEIHDIVLEIEQLRKLERTSRPGAEAGDELLPAHAQFHNGGPRGKKARRTKKLKLRAG